MNSTDLETAIVEWFVARDGQTFSTEGHIENFIVICGHMYYIHYISIIALKTLTRTFYIS